MPSDVNGENRRQVTRCAPHPAVPDAASLIQKDIKYLHRYAVKHAPGLALLERGTGNKHSDKGR
jgi:hypothetical protein